MLSEAKIAANRRNAQRSTGPRTPSGKLNSSLNALKHGLCARRPLIAGESETEFAQFTADWAADLKPLTARERFVAGEAILAAWQIQRVAALRAGLLSSAMQLDRKRDQPLHPFAVYFDTYPELARIDRHHTKLERTLRENLKELKELQKEREAADCADSADEEALQNEPTELAEMPEPVHLEHTVIVFRSPETPLNGGPQAPGEG